MDTSMDNGSGSAFPLVVAALSTGAALLLFFSGTVPAMQEDQHLREVEAGRARIQDEFWTELDSEVSNRLAWKIDIQSLLVELDRRGIDTWAILNEESTVPGTQPDPDPGRAPASEPPDRRGH